MSIIKKGTWKTAGYQVSFKITAMCSTPEHKNSKITKMLKSCDNGVTKPGYNVSNLERR